MACEPDAWELTCSYAFEKKRTGYIALVFEAYFDAALTSPRSRDDFPVHTVAVYLAKQDDWRKIRKEWKRDLGNVPYFHMTDFEFAYNRAKRGKPIPSTSPYHGLEESDFLPLLNRVHKIIARRNRQGEPRIQAFASHVVKSAFDTLRPAELATDPHCASYYIFNVSALMKTIRNWMHERNIDEPVHYIFAGGDAGEVGYLNGLFDDLFADLGRAHRFRLNKGFGKVGYDIGWMKAEPAIQAADIGCYELHKNVLLWIEMGYPDAISPDLRRKALSALTAMGMEFRGLTYRGQQIREQFEERLREIRGEEVY